MMEFIVSPVLLENVGESTQSFCGSVLAENSRQPKVLEWKRPRDGYVAVNCDGSFRSSTDSGGYGVIIRDMYGYFIGAEAKCLQKNQLRLMKDKTQYRVIVLKIEMLAIRDGLRLANNLKLTHVEIQSDSQTAISILRGYANCPAECVDVYSEICCESVCFRQLDFFFVYRETNRAADFLSKLLKCDGEKYLKCLSELPGQLHKILLEDCTINYKRF